MPLFYQHNINENTRLGIWQIGEEADFFLQTVPLKKDVSHPHKRLQHLAGRFLLPSLFPDFPLEEIVIADTRKPFLENERYHFSISHCGGFAAAIVSSSHRVGIDLELIHPKIEKIRHKFLSPEEYALALKNGPLAQPADEFRILTLLWCAKEAMYKWYGDGQMDFKRDMRLSSGIISSPADWTLLDFDFEKNESLRLSVKARFFKDLVLAWVLS